MNMTVKEVAELYRVTPNGLYRMIRAGRVPAHKPAGRYLFNRSEIMAHIENSRVQPEAKPVHITVGVKKRSRSCGEVYNGQKKWVG